MGLLVSDKGCKALKAAVKRKGVVEGSEMARVFAWLRPNDLIWNYWVNNYLLGNKPPAFDILFWNADTTRLPAAFHADLLGIFENNPYVQRRHDGGAGRADRHAPRSMSMPTSSPASPTTSRRGRPATRRRASTARRASSCWPTPATCRAC